MRATIVTRQRKDRNLMATTFSRRHESGDESPQAVQTIQVVPVGQDEGEYVLPATRRGVAAQAAAALGLLTGLWVAISPLFLTLQHGGGVNAGAANVIVGLVVAGLGTFSLVSRRGFPGLQFTTLVLGVWVLISSFILDAKFSIAAPMYWSNTWSGVVLVALALGGLATLRRATR
jgi:hypothetical protein